MVTWEMHDSKRQRHWDPKVAEIVRNYSQNREEKEWTATTR